MGGVPLVSAAGSLGSGLPSAAWSWTLVNPSSAAGDVPPDGRPTVSRPLNMLANDLPPPRPWPLAGAFPAAGRETTSGAGAVGVLPGASVWWAAERWTGIAGPMVTAGRTACEVGRVG